MFGNTVLKRSCFCHGCRTLAQDFLDQSPSEFFLTYVAYDSYDNADKVFDGPAC
jgi:hypothetical protein